LRRLSQFKQDILNQKRDAAMEILDNLISELEIEGSNFDSVIKKLFSLKNAFGSRYYMNDK
jgi:hypothetical protein